MRRSVCRKRPHPDGSHPPSDGQCEHTDVWRGARAAKPAWEQEIVSFQCSLPNPCALGGVAQSRGMCCLTLDDIIAML